VARSTPGSQFNSATATRSKTLRLAGQALGLPKEARSLLSSFPKRHGPGIGFAVVSRFPFAFRSAKECFRGVTADTTDSAPA